MQTIREITESFGLLGYGLHQIIIWSLQITWALDHIFQSSSSSSNNFTSWITAVVSASSINCPFSFRWSIFSLQHPERRVFQKTIHTLRIGSDITSNHDLSFQAYTKVKHSLEQLVCFSFPSIQHLDSSLPSPQLWFVNSNIKWPF